MKEFYPYTIIPQKVEKIRQEGIPLPKLPKLLPAPEKVRRKFLGTILFVLSAVAFTILATRSTSYMYYTYASFFIALISLVAMIFEFVQYGKLKKQYAKDMKHYKERKEAYKNVKAKQEEIDKENKNKEHVKEFQQKQIHEFFKASYDVINAVHNEYSSAKKRFKLFLEEYFPDEVLDNIKVVHRTKKINYVPDYVIQFEKPKLNVAIEIEEPYTLSNVPENIQKDYEAKDRLRQRFSNELGWIVIVLSEEQAVISPTECCKFVEDSIESVFDDIKNGDQFANIKPIKKQKMLTGEERAQLKKSKYRERYLIDAGLLDGPVGYQRKKEIEEKSEKLEKKQEIEKTDEINGSGKVEKEKTIEIDETTDKPELSKAMKTQLEKKKEIENEQMQLIKKIAKKAKTVSDDNGGVVEEKEVKKEPIKFQTEESEVKVEKKEVEKTEVPEAKKEESSSKKSDQLKREEDILKDLYQALDKHSKKQKGKEVEKAAVEVEKEEKHVAEVNKEETVKEKVISKSERKVKSAAEIILERKQQLEKKQQIEEVKEEKVELKEEKVETPVKEEAKFVEAKVEPEKKEIEIEKPEIKPESKEEKVEDKKVDLVEDKKETESDIGEEAQKNQELIDAYREKIEGAVFDKQWDELMNLCDQAIKEIPYWDWAYYRRSTAWGHKKDFSKVILDCNKAIGFNPTLADAYYNRGTARFFLGKYMEACDDYQKSIDLNYIKKADAYFNRGLCFQKLDHKKKAYREFLKAKEMGSQKAIEIIKNHYTE